MINISLLGKIHSGGPYQNSGSEKLRSACFPGGLPSGAVSKRTVLSQPVRSEFPGVF